MKRKEQTKTFIMISNCKKKMVDIKKVSALMHNQTVTILPLNDAGKTT